MTASSAKKPFPYEFGGPIWTAANALLLPVLTLLLVCWADLGGLDFGFLQSFREEPFWEAFVQSPVLCPSCTIEAKDDGWPVLVTCTTAVVAWFLFQVLLERWLPCDLVQGVPVKGNQKHRLTYRINGHLAFWVTLAVLQAGWPFWDEASGTVQFTSFPYWDLLYDYCAELAFVASLLCYAGAVYLYVSSFQGKKILADPGCSGNFFYDFWMGRELNPRTGSFDWKEFCELRPGLIGWMLLNLASMKKQYDLTGYVTGSMMLVNLFHGIYVWDALYQERAILTTMDITTDGFGYMLLFGDLVWVPFTYSLQARYLVHHDPHLSALQLAAIVAVHCTGYWIFRSANGQKDAFRRNPDDPAVSHLKFLRTRRGTKLLTTGWWGRARKINYTGDYLMGLSWCLLCGFDSILPYYYAVYFLILLVHRSNRDDELCHAKYGEDWETYKKLVPCKFIPGVF